MKKIFSSLVMIVMVSAVAIGATQAWFTDQETMVNGLSTGKLDVELRGSYASGIVIPVDTTQYFEGGMVPGQEFGPYAVQVYNKGWGESTVPVQYSWTSSYTGGSELLYDKLDVKVREGNCDWLGAPWFTEPQGVLYSMGPLQSMGRIVSASPLGVNIIRCTWFTFELPSNAGNEYQGLNTQFDLLLDATQVENPGWTE
jgi:predicted ribosomally synthesized peptide with SipW-like signal peptide